MPTPYPPNPAQMAALPGYVPNLHQRVPNDRTCLLCDNDWPCAPAKTQMRQAYPFTNSFWLLPRAEFLRRAGRAAGRVSSSRTA